MILDTLADRGVPGTFFQVGRCAQRHPDVTRRVVDEGHVLGNHSLTHELGSYLRDADQRAEVTLGRMALAEIAGVAPRLYRPPWLCHWPWVLRGIAGTGSQVVSGTFVHPLEMFQPSIETFVAGAVRAAAPGAMIIVHDGRESRGGFRGRECRSGRADHRPTPAARLRLHDRRPTARGRRPMGEPSARRTRSGATAAGSAGSPRCWWP